MDIDISANFDIKIGFILKEMIKMAKSDKTSGGDINLIDIVDLLKAHLEESSYVSTLKSEIVFYVFEYLLLSDTKELYDCDLVPKIVEIVFMKYLKKKDFDSAVNFCKYMTRKFDAIHKGRVNKKAKFVLVEGIKEHFKIFVFYFIFQNEYFLQRIISLQSQSSNKNGNEINNELEAGKEEKNNASNKLAAHPQLDEDTTKAFLTVSRNFMKVTNSLAFYDKKLDSVKEILSAVRCTRLLQSLQLFLGGVATRFKSEDLHNNEEKSLKAIVDIVGNDMVGLAD